MEAAAAYVQATKAQALAASAQAAASIRTVSFDPSVPITLSRTTVANSINPVGVMMASFANRARFDYDLCGTLAGLLVEPATTKVGQYALDMNTQFTPASMTKVAGQADLFGTSNGIALTCSAGVGQHFATSTAAGVTAGTVYCVSVIVKAGSTATAVQLCGGSSAFGTASYANFDMVNAAVGLKTGVIDAGIKAMGNGYVQLWLVMPAIATGTFTLASLALVPDTTAGRLASWSAAGNEAITVLAFECEAGFFPTSFVTTAGGAGLRANDYVTFNTAALGMGASVYAARAMFDDQTTQPVKADCTSDAWLIPTSLNRGRIKQVTFSPWAARTTELIQMIGQSNAGISGTDVGATYYTVPTEIDDIQRFAMGAFGNGDPVQAGAQIPAAALRGARELYDIGGYANYPGTLVAWLSNRRQNRLSLTKSRYLVRTDALGGIPVSYLLSGAESGTYTAGAAKYFYVNARATRQRAAVVAGALGDSFRHRMVMIHGEDTSIAMDQYQSWLSANIIDAHYADAVTDVGTAPASFVIMQTNGQNTSGGADQRMGPLAHLAETRRRAGTGVVLAGPMYQFPHSADAIHLHNTGRLMMADLINYVHRQVDANGSYVPLDIARTAVPGLAANQGLRSIGLLAGTQITAGGNGTGGLGTYTVNNSQTVASAGAPQRFVAFGAVFDGWISGTTLAVSNIVSGALDVVIDGAVVKVTLNRSVSVDASWVPSVGAALGWEWSDASARTISNIAVSGATVTLTLSGSPTGAKVLGYAMGNCAAPYLRSGGAGGTNWAAPRGQIYHDSGEASEAYLQKQVGWPTIREYLVRLYEVF